MEIIEIQPTPNPNAVKVIVDGQLTDKPLSFFNAEAGQSHALASQLFAITGVSSLLILNDFVTVSKSPNAHWKEITPKVKKVLAAWNG